MLGGNWIHLVFFSKFTYETVPIKHPDSKVHGINMGPIWGRQGPDVPHVSPMNFIIWDIVKAMST